MSVFVFVVKEAFDSPCLPQNYKDEIEISELVELTTKTKTLTDPKLFTKEIVLVALITLARL